MLLTPTLPGLRPHHHAPLHLVTMQIFLSPLPKRTGFTKTAVATAMLPSVYPPASGPPPVKAASEKTKARARKKPAIALPLQQKSPCESPFSPISTPTYKSPTKSPSQYFQICYWSPVVHTLVLWSPTSLLEIYLPAASTSNSNLRIRIRNPYWSWRKLLILRLHWHRDKNSIKIMSK